MQSSSHTMPSSFSRRVPFFPFVNYVFFVDSRTYFHQYVDRFASNFHHNFLSCLWNIYLYKGIWNVQYNNVSYLFGFNRSCNKNCFSCCCRTGCLLSGNVRSLCTYVCTRPCFYGAVSLFCEEDQAFHSSLSLLRFHIFDTDWYKYSVVM